MIAPPEALEPYNAVAAAPFNMFIDSTSSGFITAAPFEKSRVPLFYFRFLNL